MATLGTTTVTLLDLKRRLDKDDKVAGLIELLESTNEILEDMLWLECNQGTGHKTTVRTGLPTATWRLLNYGVPKSKSTTAQIMDTCGMLEAYAEVDKSLVDINNNAPAWRLSEDLAFIEAMNQQFAATLFYGNTATDPEKFVGFSPRYLTPSATTTDSGYNIINGGVATGQTDATSIFLVVWGANTVHGIYPQGTKAGLEVSDLGEQTLYDADGGMYQGYRSHYKWDCGLTVRDWRYVVRIAGIDVANLCAKSSAADLCDLMIKAIGRVPNMHMGKAAFYMNGAVKTMLEIQERDDVSSGGGLNYCNVSGHPVLSFRGIPVRRCDGISLTTTGGEPDVNGETFGTP